MTKQSEELKPCPMCGKIPELYNDDYAVPTRAWITCECGVLVKACDTAEQAILVWNTRTEKQGLDYEKLTGEELLMSGTSELLDKRTEELLKVKQENMRLLQEIDRLKSISKTSHINEGRGGEKIVNIDGKILYNLACDYLGQDKCWKISEKRWDALAKSIANRLNGGRDER